MKAFAESEVEAAALGWLEELGWQVLPGPEIGPEAAEAKRERASYAEMLLPGRLRAALGRLNPGAPGAAIEAAIARILATEAPSLILENRRLHGFLADGVPVEVVREDGSIGGGLLRLLDAETPERNDFLAVNQLAVVEGGHSRRPDIVLFVNGLPLAVIELKNPGTEAATLLNAFHQLQTYKAQIPSLFRTNGLLVVSDGLLARAGSLTGDLERFMPWRTVDGDAIAPKGTPELRTLLAGIFAPERLAELLAGYVVFKTKATGQSKRSPAITNCTRCGEL